MTPDPQHVVVKIFQGSPKPSPVPSRSSSSPPNYQNLDDEEDPVIVTTITLPPPIRPAIKEKHICYWCAVICCMWIFATVLLLGYALFMVYLHPLGNASIWNKLNQNYKETLPSYLGCFNNVSELYGSSPITDENMNTFSCLEHCKNEGFYVAVTYNGTECSCGKALSLVQFLPQVDECSSECGGGYPNEICGGDRSASVYKIVGSLSITEGSNRYTISPKKGSFDEGKSYCQSVHGGDLAVSALKNITQRQKLMTKFNAAMHVPLWIGLSDVDVEGEWLWSDGSQALNEEVHWSDEQPSQEDDEDQDCAVIAGEAWNTYDENCLLQYQALCEFDKISS